MRTGKKKIKSPNDSLPYRFLSAQEAPGPGWSSGGGQPHSMGWTDFYFLVKNVEEFRVPFALQCVLYKILHF